MTAMSSLSGPNADHVARASPHHRLHDLDAHAPGGAFHRAHGRLDGVGVEVHQLRLGDLPHLSSEGGFAPLPKPPPRNRCAGKAGARTSITSHDALSDSRPHRFFAWSRRWCDGSTPSSLAVASAGGFAPLPTPPPRTPAAPQAVAGLGPRRPRRTIWISEPQDGHGLGPVRPRRAIRSLRRRRRRSKRKDHWSRYFWRRWCLHLQQLTARR